MTLARFKTSVLTSLQKTPRSTYASVGIITFVAVMYGLVYLYLPFYSDDLMYIRHMGDWSESAGGLSNWTVDGLLNAIQLHWATDNCRLANVVFMLALALPKWLIDICSAFLVGFAIWMICKISKIGILNTKGVIFASFLWIFLLPWRNNLWISDYSFNYLYSSAIFLTCCYYALFSARPNATVGFFLGLLCGLWHEGFGTPLAVGCIGLVCIFKGKYRTKILMSMACGVVLAVICLLTSPGALTRMEGGWAVNTSSVLNATAHNLPLLLFIFTLALSWRKITSRKSDSERATVVFLLFCAIASFAIHCKTNFSFHISWCADLCSIIGIALCLRVLLHNITHNNLIKISAAGMILIIGVHLSAVAYASALTASNIRRAKAMYQQSETGEIFFTPERSQTADLLSLLRPYDNSIFNAWNAHYFRVYTAKKDYREGLHVVPPELAYLTMQKVVAMNSCNGLYRYDKHIVAPGNVFGGKLNLAEPTECRLRVKIGPVSKSCQVLFTPFTSLCDGNRYFYIQILSSEFLEIFGKIEKIELAPIFAEGV